MHCEGIDFHWLPVFINRVHSAQPTRFCKRKILKFIRHIQHSIIYAREVSTVHSWLRHHSTLCNAFYFCLYPCMTCRGRDQRAQKTHALILVTPSSARMVSAIFEMHTRAATHSGAPQSTSVLRRHRTEVVRLSASQSDARRSPWDLAPSSSAAKAGEKVSRLFQCEGI